MQTLTDQLLELRPHVLAYCRSRVAHDAEDVAQEVMVAVLAALPAYEDRGAPFAAYVFTIAKGKVADVRRAAYRRPSTPTADLPDDPDPAPGPEERALRGDLARRLGRLVDRLPDRAGAVVRLRYAAGWSAPEVGAALGMPEATVRVTAMRALQRLRVLATAPTG